MAMIRCPECGREVSDKAIKCINCGYPLNENVQNNQEVPSNNQDGIKKSVNKKSLLIISAISVCLIIIVLVFIMNSPGTYYKRGMKALNAENYESAIKYFEKAGAFEDAQEKCNEARILFDYHEGLKCIENSMWEEAEGYFIKTNDYSDSKALLTQCDYQIAIQKMNDGDYENAVSLFETIVDYEDSNLKINECNYLLGTKFEEEGDLMGAAEKYSAANDYEDSDDKIADIGKRMVEEGSYEESLKAFNLLKNNNMREIPEANYANGMMSIERKKYDDAVNYFEKAKNYKDANEKYVESAYLNGEANFKKKLYVEAKRNYSLASDYSDSKEKIKACMLLQAKRSMNEGRLPEAKNLLEEMDSDYSYDGVEVKNLLDILNKNEKWMSVGGKWKSKSGQMKSEQKGSFGYDYYWHREIGEGDYYLDVSCPIDDDGTVYILIEGTIPAYSNYASVSSLLETKKIMLNSTNEISGSGTIKIDDCTTVSISKDKVTVNYKKVDKSKDVYFDYIYSTNITYIK